MMRISVARAAEAAKILDLELDGLKAKAVTKAYRDASKECHPDAGAYDAARWSAISGARKALLAYLDQGGAVSSAAPGPRGTCRACSGTGLIKQRSGFSAGLTMTCVLCGGTGNVRVSDQEA